MKAIKFLDYLQMNAPICISDEKGNILYSGELGNCPRSAFSGRDILDAQLSMCEHDIIITVSERRMK